MPRDSAKAREWYEKAAAQGNVAAKIALYRLQRRERYGEALQRQVAFTAKVQAEEIKRDGKPGEQTAAAFTKVIWYALLSEQFNAALTVATHACTLFPKFLSIEGNRVHALMFMGRGDEAKALYLAHKGQPVFELQNKLWEQMVAEDFAEFRKVDLWHGMMADIEKELGISR